MGGASTVKGAQPTECPGSSWQDIRPAVFNIVAGNGLAYRKLQDSWRNVFKALRHELLLRCSSEEMKLRAVRNGVLWIDETT